VSPLRLDIVCSPIIGTVASKSYTLSSLLFNGRSISIQFSEYNRSLVKSRPVLVSLKFAVG